jgi:hypothetical protein
MVLLSLGSGLITALMAQAKPAREPLDLAWITDDASTADLCDDSNAVKAVDKTVFQQ